MDNKAKLKALVINDKRSIIAQADWNGCHTGIEVRTFSVHMTHNCEKQ
jgi:hypothetical protein